MRRSPCSSDVYGPEIHLEEDTSSKESGNDDSNWSIGDDSESSLDDPGLNLDFDEYDSEHTSSGESDGDNDDRSTDNDSELSPDDPGLDQDFDDSDSDWFRLRRRLWKLLGYDMVHCSEVIAGTKHMWQTNSEIETLQAFGDRRNVSYRRGRRSAGSYDVFGVSKARRIQADAVGVFPDVDAGAI